ncbi:MAG: hypothetical protein IPO92_15280 [Saprospiraceae bacterium]|nr:hypothetical protein [Saprospiraceae bacterium]
MNRNNNEIHAELEILAPTLAAMPKVMHYHVPEGYFEAVEDQILSQMALTEMDNHVGMDVPEGYFNRLEDIVMEQVAIMSKSNDNLVSLQPVRKLAYLKYVAAAASITLVITMLFFFNNKDLNIDTATSDNVTHDEYITYIQQNMDEFDINQLIEHELIDSTVLDNITYLESYDEAGNSDNFIESDINF